MNYLSYCNYGKTPRDDGEYPRRVDEMFAIAMKKLRDTNLFKKEDIQKDNLIRRLTADQDNENCDFLPELRLRFLLDTNPSFLATTIPEG